LVFTELGGSAFPFTVRSTPPGLPRRICTATFSVQVIDVPAWSEATAESAVRGTPEQCAEQIAAYLDAGVKELVFCPYNYELEQVQRLAIEVLPLLEPQVRVRAPVVNRAD